MSEKNLPAYLAPTFAERRAAREAEEGKPKKAAVEPKQVDEDSETTEDKAVKAASTKRRAAKKS